MELSNRNKHKTAKTEKGMTVYAHNMGGYDWYVIYNRRDHGNITYFSYDPFIAKYEHNGRDAATFLDTMSLYPFSLAKALS